MYVCMDPVSVTRKSSGTGLVYGLLCVLFMILPRGFVQANALSSEFRSSSYDYSSNSMLWSSLLL